jgi:hypothetical protein
MSFQGLDNQSNITNQEVKNIHKIYKKTIDEAESDIDSSENDTDSSENSNHNQKIILKKGTKKETTMLYMFKKYELLQNECNQYKNKLYKMKIRAHSEEQKQHYKNLEFSNLLLEQNDLKENLKKHNYTLFKYYASTILNILFGITIAFVTFNQELYSFYLQ